MSLKPPEKVRKLQTALHAKAKAAPRYRFYLLYDKLYREDLLAYAYRVCRANGGAPGVDGQTFEDIEAYDGETDRIEQAEGPGLPNNGANYAYVSNSHLLDEIDVIKDTTVQASTKFSYESTRDLIIWVENKLGATTVSKYAYYNDELGRRGAVTRNGSAFVDPNDPNSPLAQLDRWSYNDRNELIGSVQYRNADPNSFDDSNTPDSNDAVTAFDRAYAFDPIGNRTEYTEDDDPPVYYCANEFNQYDTIDDANSCPATSPTEEFEYDEDGNLKRDGTFKYTWDAENRMRNIPSAPVAAEGDVPGFR